jgi:chemotaxis protein MotB
MKPKYLEPDSRSRDRWMVSYLDVMTILLIFFISVALKAEKQAPPPSAAPASEVTAAPTPLPVAASPRVEPPPPPLADLQNRLAAHGLDVHREERGVVVSLPQAILFASGDDRISPNARPILGKLAGEIRDLPNKVTLVGYTDGVPISNHRFRNNWELAAARGLRLFELLSGEYEIDESRLSVSSQGANQPKESNQTARGRAFNRRVEIVIAAE